MLTYPLYENFSRETILSRNNNLYIEKTSREDIPTYPLYENFSREDIASQKFPVTLI